jgi:hypothetical protein
VAGARRRDAPIKWSVSEQASRAWDSGGPVRVRFGRLTRAVVFVDVDLGASDDQRLLESAASC